MSRQDENPYASPSAAASIPASVAGRRTRWRVIPVTLLLIFVPLSLVFSPIHLYVVLGRVEALGEKFTLLRMIGVSLYVVGGAFWTAGGLLCWHTRWRLSTAVLLLGLAAYCVLNILLWDLGLQPRPGRRNRFCRGHLAIEAHP